MSTVCIKLKMTVRRCIWGNIFTSEAVVVVPGNHIKVYKLIGVGGRAGEGQACRGWRGGSIQLWQILVKGAWRSSNSLSYKTVRKGPVGQHSTCSIVQEWTDRQLQQGYSSLHMNNLSSNNYCWMSGNWHSVRLPDFHLPHKYLLSLYPPVVHIVILIWVVDCVGGWVIGKIGTRCCDGIKYWSFLPCWSDPEQTPH